MSTKSFNLILCASMIAHAACSDDASSNGPDGGLTGDTALADATPDDSGGRDAGSTDRGDAAGGPESIEIAGVYASNFGAEEIITEDAFNGTPIRAYDNDENFVITQNPPDASFNPDLFNRIVWTEKEGEIFYHCFVDFGLETLEAALESEQTADDSDPETRGCGGFAWTRLREAIEIRGEYESNFGGTETVTATIWQQGGPPMRLVDWSEDDQWVVTQNDEEADFNPSRFNRVEYTEPQMSGTFYYCFVDFGLPTAEAAITSTVTADPSDPETGGCGGFSWTRLDPR
jgi:hypothetical protein